MVIQGHPATQFKIIQSLSDQQHQLWERETMLSLIPMQRPPSLIRPVRSAANICKICALVLSEREITPPVVAKLRE